MRAIVALLLLADIVLLGWGVVRPPASPGQTSVPPELPIGVESLQLLSEISPSTKRPAGPAASGGGCMRAAPFSDADMVDDVLERAASVGIAAAAESVEISGGPPDLQVHLPPLPSADQASRAVRELHALGMEAFLVLRGPLAGAVSVGMFTARERAEVRRAEVMALGYPARIAEIPRTRQAYEVRFRPVAHQGTNRFLALAREDWPDIRIDRVPCEDP
jgi:hypothetical protein